MPSPSPAQAQDAAAGEAGAVRAQTQTSHAAAAHLSGLPNDPKPRSPATPLLLTRAHRRQRLRSRRLDLRGLHEPKLGPPQQMQHL